MKKNRKTLNLQHITKRKVFLLTMVFLSFCAVVFYIFYCTKGQLHSDYAYWLLLADEQMKTGQFYPEGFHYTTGLPTVSPQLFVLVIRFFCSDWLLSREIAVLITILILFTLLYYFCKNTLAGKEIYVFVSLSVILLGLPMQHYAQTYYEAAYALQIIWDLVLMILISKLLGANNNKVKKRNALFAGLFFAAFLISMSSRNIIIFMIPLLLAIIVTSFVECEYHFENVFKNKLYTSVFAILVLGVILGYPVYLLLVRKMGVDSAIADMVFVSSEEVKYNISNLFVGIIEYYSAIIPGEMITISGITSCINFVVMFICTIIAPLSMILRFNKIENNFWKLYTLYAMFSDFFVLYLMVFTNANNIRYYQPVFWHHIVFTCFWLTSLIKHKSKYCEGFIYSVVACIFLLGHLCYINYTVVPVYNESVSDQTGVTLVSFLEEHDLDYGFATFWNAYGNMILSDGRITMAAYQGTPLTPFKWMTSDSYYDVNKHPGKCFVLVAPDETLEEKWYSAAMEILNYDDYTILVYEKNIYMYSELQE